MGEIIHRRICKEQYTSRKASNWGQLEGNYLFFDINLSHTYDDMGIYSLNAKEWVPGKRYYKGDFVFYAGRSFELGVDHFAGYYDEEKEELYFDQPNEEGELFDEDGKFLGTNWVDTSDPSYSEQLGTLPSTDGSTSTFTKQDAVSNTPIEQQTSSRLTGLRRKKHPSNDDGTEVLPNLSDNVDWLLLYVPNLVLNIDGDTEMYIEDGERKSRLINATGDRVLSYEQDEENRLLTIRYEIGVHLQDETLEPIDGTGVEYTDVYNYDPEIFQFDGDFENLSMDNLGIFSTLLSKSATTRTIGQHDSDKGIILSDSTFTDNYRSNYANVFREEQFFGITFKPKVEKQDILIDRGINAAFERHLKLGEIKTMEDLLNYQNGGFYQIKSNE